MTTVVRNRAITDTPLANKRVALTAFTSHPVYRRFLQTRTGVQTTFMLITPFYARH